MLLPAPFILPKQWQPSPKGAMAKGVGSHFTFQAGGVGGLGVLPPPNLCQQEAMTHLNPKSCILVGSGNASFQLSTPRLVGCWRGSAGRGSPEVRASCLSVQLWGWPLGGRTRLRYRYLDTFLSRC